MCCVQLVPEPSTVKQSSLAAEPTVRYKTDSGDIVDSSDGQHVDTSKAFDSDDSHSGTQASACMLCQPGVQDTMAAVCFIMGVF